MDSVSVVIPTIGRDALAQAVASVWRQQVQVEVIVVDDSGNGQVDESAFPGVRVLRTAGRVGAAEARNIGMGAATGAFVAFLDDDDEWMPGHLLDALRMLRERPDATVYASRGLVLDEEGRGRLEPAVLIGERTVAQYFFEQATWCSRNRRLLTPTLVFRAGLADHRMESERVVNEDTWWLLTAERDRGARLVQSPHVGVVVHQSSERNAARYDLPHQKWLDEINELYPGAAAAEQLAVHGRSAVREGRPGDITRMARGVVLRPGGLRWAPVLAGHAAGAAVVRGLQWVRRLRD